MKISIIIPVYNECRTVLQVIERVMAVDLEKELIVVDDGSSDGTRELLREQLDGRYANLRIVYRAANGGKGAALREGFALARGDVLVVQDSDLEYDPVDIPALVAPITAGHADAVYGTRYSGGLPQRVHLFWHLMGNKLISGFADLLFNATLSDIETGYKAIRRELLQRIPLRSSGFAIEAELTAKILKTHCRVYEIPIHYYGRDYSEGKKIRWTDGVWALLTLLRYRFRD